MTKSIILFAFLAIQIITFAQQNAADSLTDSNLNSSSIQINLGLINKVRGQFEYNFNAKNSIVFSASKCYGAANPGNQFYIQYKFYFNESSTTKNFMYLKTGLGKSFSQNGKYALVGLGFGQKLKIGTKNKFYFQFSEGFKYCPILSGDVEAIPGSGLRGLFYIVGPGSFLEINTGFGINL